MQKQRIRNEFYTVVVAKLKELDPDLTKHQVAALARHAFVTGYAMRDAQNRVRLIEDRHV